MGEARLNRAIAAAIFGERDEATLSETERAFIADGLARAVRFMDTDGTN